MSELKDLHARVKGASAYTGNYGRFGFASEGKIFLQRCPTCTNENWAPAVASGRCAWCGTSPTHEALLSALQAQGEK